MCWQAIIRLYKIKHYPTHVKECDWFARQPTLARAIQCAAMAIREDGKRFNHQRRAPKTALEQACGELLHHEQRISECTTFDGIIKIVEGVASDIYGLGPLYVYDTALRIGSRRGIYPDRVYLHCGTRVGARRHGLPSKGKWIEMSDLPEPLRVLSASEVEDILCIFKNSSSRRPTKRCR